MTEVTTMTGVASPASETAVAVAERTQQPEPSAAGQHGGMQVDAEIMATLAQTQNNCFAELGYYPTLLQDFHELQKMCAQIKADNEKLYTDNRSLAQFIQTQDQRIQMLAAPVDQQKRTLAELHERVRVLSAERDELTGRLHAALNEVLLLRQELSRFIPTARVVPAHERLPTGHPPQAPQQRAAPMQVPQRMVAQHPPNLAPYQRQPSVQHRPIQPLPTHRHSQGSVYPVNGSAPPPTIAQHRRTSAPAPLAIPQNGIGPSPASASPLNNFSGLSLASPATPLSSRPSTAGAPASAPPAGFAPHTIPAQPSGPAPSSLAGQFVDLTAEESDEQETARKRRKIEHTPDAAMVTSRPPSAQHASPVGPPTGLVVANGDVAPPEPNAVVEPQHSPVSPSSATPVEQAPVAEQPVDSDASQRPQDDVDMEQQQSTLEEDCLEVNFDADGEDENKLWCVMCRSRYQKGHTKEPPSPFVGAPEQQLIEHCETVHPEGWKTLKDRMAKLRAEDPGPA
ncbi:hypothetical protein BD414DRAFT_472872 [Trametes punicea]|nr:hypothetical protein BD414DRAFT_472872 [Trametes punicea]